MKSQFKLINEKENILLINGVKMQIADKNISFVNSFIPSLYHFNIMEGPFKGCEYIGKSILGSSTRIVGHTTHLKREQLNRIDEVIKDAKKNGYLIKVSLIGTYNSIPLLDKMEKVKIRERARDIYNEITHKDTDYKSYKNYYDIISKKLLNDALI